MLLVAAADGHRRGHGLERSLDVLAGEADHPGLSVHLGARGGEPVQGLFVVHFDAMRGEDMHGLLEDGVDIVLTEQFDPEGLRHRSSPSLVLLAGPDAATEVRGTGPAYGCWVIGRPPRHLRLTAGSAGLKTAADRYGSSSGSILDQGHRRREPSRQGSIKPNPRLFGRSSVSAVGLAFGTVMRRRGGGGGGGVPLSGQERGGREGRRTRREAKRRAGVAGGGRVSELARERPRRTRQARPPPTRRGERAGRDHAPRAARMGR